MDDLSKGLKYFFFGFLLYPMMIEVTGFLTPLYAVKYFPNNPVDNMWYFYELFEYKIPWFSLLYIPGAYYLTKYQSIFGKLLTWLVVGLSVFMNLSFMIEFDDEATAEVFHTSGGLLEPFLICLVLFISFRATRNKKVDDVV